MAVLTVGELWAERDADWANEKNERSYTRAFKVVCDSVDDGPMTVLQDSRIPLPYSVYTERNGLADIGTRLVRRNVKQDDDNPLVWIVECEYENSTTDVKDPPENPLLKAPTYEWSFSRYKRIVEKADLLDVNGNVALADAAITNSARAPYDPPPEKDDSRPILTYSINQLQFFPSVAVEYADAVNEDPFLGVDPGKAKIVGISGKQHWHKEYGSYWEVTITIEFREEGWDLKILDAGFFDTNGKIFQDSKGEPYPKPQRLDGLGAMLPLATPADESIFFTYRVYKRKNFTALGI